MNTKQKKCYVAIWYINIDSVLTKDTINYTNEAKQTMTGDGYAGSFCRA